jgi:hypothetical protein
MGAAPLCRIGGDSITELGTNRRPGAGAPDLDATGHLAMPADIDSHTARVLNERCLRFGLLDLRHGHTRRKSGPVEEV